MPFDPDAYAVESAKPFDPDAYAAPEKPKRLDAKPGVGEALARGAAQGATLGFADEIGGMANAGVKVPGDIRTPGPKALARLYPGVSYPDAAAKWFDANRPDVQAANAAESARLGQQANYEAERDRIREADRSAREAHPIAFGAGELGGAVATAPLLPMAASVRGAPLLARVAQGARSAAPVGAAFGFGASDQKDLPGQLVDTVTGAGTAAGIGTAVPVVGKLMSPVASWAGDKLGNWAEVAAVRSTNADRTATRRAFKGSDEARHALGRFMLDENVSLRSPQAIRDAAKTIQQRVGPEIGDLAARADASGTAVNLANVVGAAKASPSVARLARNTVTRNAHDQIIEMLDDQIVQHGGQVKPSVAHDIRMQLDELANWDQAAPKQVQKAWRAARDEVDQALDAAMTKAGLGDEWGKANASFSSARKLSNPNKRGLADIGTERREGNRLGSPSEKASALAGATAAFFHNPIAAVALPAGTIAANRYAFPVAARTFNALSRLSPPPSSVPVMSLTPQASAMAEAIRNRMRLGLTPVPAEDTSP